MGSLILPLILHNLTKVVKKNYVASLLRQYCILKNHNLLVPLLAHTCGRHWWPKIQKEQTYAKL